MDKQKTQDWKASMELMNQVTLEEVRDRTPAERMLIHQAFLNRLTAMGKQPKADRDFEDHMAWSRIQEIYLARRVRS